MQEVLSYIGLSEPDNAPLSGGEIGRVGSECLIIALLGPILEYL